MEIQIDFDVFKALTARRTSEAVSYNDVLRELLGFEATLSRRIGETLLPLSKITSSFATRSAALPEGTLLRARYKGSIYTAVIKGGKWMDSNGVEHGSPSAAARFVTGTNVNGLRFWEAKRPEDVEWRKLEALPDSLL